MSKLSIYLSVGLVSVIASPAFAQVAPVPEPGMFGIMAAGVVAVLVAARIARRLK